MSLDLGAVVGRVVLETTEFDRQALRVQRVLANFGGSAEKSAGGIATLERGLTGTAAAADKASTSTTRLSQSESRAAASADKAAAAASRHSQAVARVGEVMGLATVDAQRMQQAELRLIAAQERYDTVMASGTATTRQLASAQAGLIGAQRSLFRTQEQIAGRMSTLTGSMDRQATAADRQAIAMERVSAITARYAGQSTQVQAAALRQVAANARLAASSAEVGSAEALQARETARVATAQATAVASADRLAAAQTRAAAASSSSVVAGGRPGGGLMRTAAELGLFFGVVEGVRKAIDITKEANTFDASMTRIETVVGASKTEIAGMSAALLGMAGQVAQAPDELSLSLYHMEAIGLRGAKALDAVRIAAEGAKIGNADLEETTNALTSTVASGITKGQSFKDTMAQLLTIVGTGDMKLSDFNDALSSGLLTIMSTYGVSLRDVGAALATFGDNNIRGANAATMLRIAVQSLASPGVGKRSQDALDKLGVSADELKAALQHGGLNEALTLLRDRMKASGIGAKEAGALITDAFTKRGAQGINVLLKQFDRVQSKYEELDKNSKNFGARWAETTKTAAFALSSLGHQFEAMGISIMGKLGPTIATGATFIATTVPRLLAPILRNIGSTIADVWSVVSPFVKLLGGGLVVAFGIAARAASILTSAVSGVAQFLRDNSTAVRILIGAFIGFRVAALAASVAQLALSAAMEVNPIVAVTTAILALGYAYKNLGGFSGAAERLGAAWDIVSDKTGKLVGYTKVTNATFDHHAHVMVNAAGAVTSYADAAGKVTEPVKLATDAQKQYATMLGYSVSKEGVVVGSAAAIKNAIAAMGDQYNHASQTVTEFLNAVSTFSKSAGTASDRAALIGATLKAGNGDRLNFISQMNAAAQAEDGLTSSIQQAAKSVGKGGVSTRAYLKSIVDLSTGTIHYNQAGAGPLISALQSIQSAGLAAAQATYQHARETMNGKDAADAAYKVYTSQTGPQLVDELTKLGLNSTEAKKLADRYLGMPKHVKTLIEAAGTDPIVTVLKQIRNMLGELTGHPWQATVDAATEAASNKLNNILSTMRTLANGVVIPVFTNPSGGVKHPGVPMRAGGGYLPQGWASVGEGGPGARPELAHTEGGKTRIYSNAQSKSIIAATGMKVPGFANGTVGQRSIYAVDGGYGFQGTYYGGKDAYKDASAALRDFVHNLHAAARYAPETARLALAQMKAAYASGRTDSILRRAGQYYFGGQGYDSRALAQEARAEAHSAGRTTARGDLSSLRGVVASTSSTVSDVAGGLRTAEGDLRAVGASSRFLAGLKGLNRKIIAEVTARNKALAKLDKDAQTLADARSTLINDRSSFSGAISGSFDISSAGADPVTGNITGGGILAQQKQAVVRARAFVAGITKLSKQLPGPYLRSIAAKGPDALPEVQALLGLSPAQMTELRAESSALDKLSAQGGSMAAETLDRGAITRAYKDVAKDRATAAKYQKAMDENFNKLVGALSHLEIGGVAKLDYRKGTLALQVRTDERWLAKAQT